MLETLLTILKWDIYSPEISFNDEWGDLSLDWFDPIITVGINRDGTINWASIEPQQHGTDFERLKIILESRK